MLCYQKHYSCFIKVASWTVYMIYWWKIHWAHCQLCSLKYSSTHKVWNYVQQNALSRVSFLKLSYPNIIMSLWPISGSELASRWLGKLSWRYYNEWWNPFLWEVIKKYLIMNGPYGQPYTTKTTLSLRYAVDHLRYM